MDWILAALALTNPSVAHIVDTSDMQVRTAIFIPARVLAAEWEIWDPVQEPTYFIHLHECGIDIGLIQRRWAWLRNAPFSCDADRWPSKETCEVCKTMAEAYVEVAASRACINPQNHKWTEHWKKVLEKSKKLVCTFSALEDAKNTLLSIPTRRVSLAHFRDFIGMDNYCNGVMPLPYPTSIEEDYSWLLFLK
jgi:hypothetical protein